VHLTSALGTALYYILMFKAEIKGDSLSIDLAPNKSSSISENLVFFGFLSLICLTFGIGFFFIGATMILPFAGLEVLALILILTEAGALLIEALARSNDQQLAGAIIFLLTATIVFVNFVTDIILAIMDPRIRKGVMGGS